MIQRFAPLLMLAMLAAACGPDSKKLSADADALGEKFLATTNQIINFNQQLDVEKLVWGQQLDSLGAGASNAKLTAPADSLKGELRGHIEGYEALQKQINDYLGGWTEQNIQLSDLKTQLSEGKLNSAQAREAATALAGLTSATEAAAAEMEKWKQTRAALHASCVKVTAAYARAKGNPTP